MSKYPMVKLGEVCTKGGSNIAQKDLVGNDGFYPIYGATGLIKNVDFYKQEEPYIAILKDGAGVGRVMKCPAKSSIIGTMQYILPNDKVDIAFLYYALIEMNLSKYWTGAAIPHIYFKDYKEEQLPLPPLEVQRQIAGELDKITSLIEKRKSQLAKLDLLIKSKFIELFGDPITNPMGWEVNYLYKLCSKIGSGATPKGGKESYKREGISLVRSMNVHNGYFKYKDLAYIDDSQAKQLLNVAVEKFDVLLNITGASVARTCIIPEKVLPARVNQHVCILRCSDALNPWFLNHLLISDSCQDSLLKIGTSNGATREAITKQQLEKFELIVPPLALQNQFAEFILQVEQAKAKMQASLSHFETLYKERMQHYFD